ncbi:MAG: hypothetical protein A3J30_04615 [Candidatus Wildermuthbacteria bacterium RIFCSPLOWO2_02_FULL_47_9c]|uniref:Methyltransferase domain family n=2 Tax=Parcubacteria group TaxID=1794811 RepID=A0A837INT2_9BACT|nr:MAG: Methyltransferase domain family [Candidatus Yanofskybacteria bacterium GW2011_GWC1_48_11]KKW04109.1 MAG: Methyltransferase domain family [Parcubacteria group bacterium GW2011_GWB1_49_12]KKW08384.1 MAG: Methyltransferase domain family [Parcubacteria group bacterium GW2011_GWA1_49_26]KKW14313.1 MAG: Methyltransferase domain family [Parcubacteria group bacterium GW2011_GWA2_50_10]OHA61157.1 MAG: hypothetical protein A2109_01445 [Candidatus Wildermuthbacteria bacterium GWA1_49_26]OHA65546.
MEERKRREIEYYDAEAVRQRVSSFVPSALGSYQFLYKVATPWIKGKKVLDYGCGDGRHTQFLAEHAKEVIGIDLSERSLEIAKKIAVREGVEEKVKFLKMDCEAMEFPDNSFDVVFDGGTFSSLDFEKAIGEIMRVLQPDGALVGIETFGHNPLTNAKRVLNRLTGKRTAWAASHIVQQKELERLRQNFEQIEVFYFHLISLSAFPLLDLPGGRLVLRLLEGIDNLLLHIPFLQKYSFKVVFLCKDPRYGKKIT